MATSDKQACKLAKYRFARKLNDFNKCVKDGKPHSLTNVKFLELSDAWHVVENAHDAYVCAIDNDDPETATKEKDYLSVMQDDYTTALQINMDRGSAQEPIHMPSPIPVNVEKIKLPRFSGIITEYTRFKKDFTKYIEPHVASETLAYTLRTCLCPDAAHLVRNVDDDVNEMWRLLDDKYANPAKITEVIMDRINNVRPFNTEDPKRFVEFVDLVEDSYADLKKLGIEHELTNSTTLGAVEKKLPIEMQKLWSMMVSNESSVIDKDNMFTELLKFMRNQKRATEYRSSHMRTNSSAHSVHNINAVECSSNVRVEQSNHTSPPVVKRCLFHTNGEHWTSDCLFYMSRDVEAKRNILRQKGACFSCLCTGHIFRDCRKKRACGEGGCLRRHHRSLHTNLTVALERNIGDINHAIVSEQMSPHMDTSDGERDTYIQNNMKEQIRQLKEDNSKLHDQLKRDQSVKNMNEVTKKDDNQKERNVGQVMADDDHIQGGNRWQKSAAYSGGYGRMTWPVYQMCIFGMVMLVLGSGTDAVMYRTEDSTSQCTARCPCTYGKTCLDDKFSASWIFVGTQSAYTTSTTETFCFITDTYRPAYSLCCEGSVSFRTKTIIN